MNYIDGYKQGVNDSIKMMETCIKNLKELNETLDERMKELKTKEEK